jgi:hypothetical protein
VAGNDDLVENAGFFLFSGDKIAQPSSVRGDNLF